MKASFLTPQTILRLMQPNTQPCRKMKKTRKQLTATLVVLPVSLMMSPAVRAGELEPPGPPTTGTMKTLDEVEPRVPIHADDLPLTITVTKSYYLTESVTFTDTASNAITVECAGVTIDLMGYTLKGPDSGIKAGIRIEANNVEIKNGTVRDFYEGIRADYTSKNNRIRSMRAISNLNIGIFPGQGAVIKDCTVSENGLHGIFAKTDTLITGSTVYNNGGYGIYFDDSPGCTITGNLAYENEYGIFSSNGSTITGNTTRDNVNDGIFACGGCTIRSNTSYSNDRDGIVALSGCTLIGNTAFLNGNDGIRVAFTAAGCTLIGNTARGNAGIGINASDFCLIDQNTATDNLGGNLFYDQDCEIGMNLAP